MNRKKITYHDYSKFDGESELILEDTLDLFEKLNWNKETFMYFEINDINLFQITQHDENRFIVEITNDSDEMIYLQKYASKNECIDLIKYFYNTNNIDNLEGFHKVPVGTKTLDEVLQESTK